MPQVIYWVNIDCQNNTAKSRENVIIVTAGQFFIGTAMQDTDTAYMLYAVDILVRDVRVLLSWYQSDTKIYSS